MAWFWPLAKGLIRVIVMWFAAIVYRDRQKRSQPVNPTPWPTRYVLLCFALDLCGLLYYTSTEDIVYVIDPSTVWRAKMYRLAEIFACLCLVFYRAPALARGPLWHVGGRVGAEEKVRGLAWAFGAVGVWFVYARALGASLLSAVPSLMLFSMSIMEGDKPEQRIDLAEQGQDDAHRHH